MRDDFPNAAPDYTRACIVMFGVNVMWILIAVWSIWGFLAASFVGYVTNKGLDRVAIWRARRRAKAIQRGKSA
jgi:uncharacterized membrane protein